MREIYSHTAIRGVAALLVVLVHYRIVLQPAFDIDQYTEFGAKGYLWVDCFFILSGFVLSYVYGTVPGTSAKARFDFLVARFARIYPLYFATLAALAAWQVIAPRLSEHFGRVGTWPSFWTNLVGIQAWLMPDAYDWNFPAWSISVEFAAYLLFPFVCFGLVRFRAATIGVISVAVVFALTIDHANWERTAIIRGVPLFCLGILLFQGRDIVRLVPALGTVQVATLAALAGSLHFGAPDFVADLLFALLILVTWTDEGLSFRGAPLQALGHWSYSIYMVHIPVRVVLGSILAGRMGAWPLLGTLTAATIILGALSYRYLEIPARQIIRKKSILREPQQA